MAPSENAPPAEYGRQRAAAVLFGLGICAVPVSIAGAECLLVGSLLLRSIAIAQHRAKLYLPRVFWFWLAWAALEVVAWLRSPAIRAGLGEMRHLLLIAALFVLVPTLKDARNQVAVWCGIVLAASASSLFVIGHFVSQTLFYRGTLDPVVYLRSGGLLHHWMIYGIVEILAFAGLLELWHYFPEEHGWLLPVAAINAAAIVLSLTRMVWICSLLLLVLHLLWRRSRWLWAVPVMLCAVVFVSPAAVQSRLTGSIHSDYYSNAERVQMLGVGWEMICQNPLTGVGPGRVEELYTKYLSASDPLPAYHGHLHNNLVQLTAEFGLPVTLAALLFITVLFRDLLTQCRLAKGRERQFLCRTSLLGLIGFIAGGLCDYTYGHSLGLILLGFVVLSPLTGASETTQGH
jgi:O-antigen ligase